MTLKKRPLGRTGLDVTEIGLGGYWYKELEAARANTDVVRKAIDLGVNFVDTAPGYKDSEAVLGEALSGGYRERVVLSTKYYPYDNEDKLEAGRANCRSTVENSLKRLKTDHLDILHMHWVHSAGDVARIPDSELGKTLLDLKKSGKIKHIALSEASELDGEHRMLETAIPTGFFEVMMVTYNIFLQTADRKVLDMAKKAGMGVEIMMVLNQPENGKSGLISPACAAENIDHLIKEAALTEKPAYRDPKLFDFLMEGSAKTLPAAAIRFALDHPAVSTVVVGTSSPRHLEENLAVSSLAPLSPAIHSRAKELFGNIVKHIK